MNLLLHSIVVISSRKKWSIDDRKSGKTQTVTITVNFCGQLALIYGFLYSKALRIRILIYTIQYGWPWVAISKNIHVHFNEFLIGHPIKYDIMRQTSSINLKFSYFCIVYTYLSIYRNKTHMHVQNHPCETVDAEIT